ncbi:MAG: Mur ligase family protein, partial [Planctomycetales bacterium]
MTTISFNQLTETVAARRWLGSPPASARLDSMETNVAHVLPGGTYWETSREACPERIQEAYRRGATGVVAAAEIKPPSGCWSLQVDDAEQALRRLVAWSRNRFEGQVACVAGGIGKSTIRSMIHAVLGIEPDPEPRWESDDENDPLGFACCFLKLASRGDLVILELGSLASEDAERWAEALRPTLTVIAPLGDRGVNGDEHQQQTERRIAALLRGLPEGSRVAADGEESWTRKLVEAAAGTLPYWFGRTGDCDLTASRVRSQGGRLGFEINGVAHAASAWGRHHLSSALAAAAAGTLLGSSPEKIVEGLAGFQTPPMRCEVFRAAGIHLINDAWQATPQSMAAALELLRDFDSPGRKIAFLG